MYSATVREHALNPKNQREMTSATAVGEASYSRCRDKLTMYFQVQDGVITDASFQAKACAPVVAAASLATTLLIGLTTEQALKLTAFDLHDALGGLPVSKRHALLLVLQCLHQALQQHLKTNS